MSRAENAAGPAPAAPPLNLGVVGLGLAGAVMVHALQTHPHVICGGVAERSEMLRARFAKDHDVAVLADIAELIARPDIEAVYIATPHQFHRDHAIAAAERGKHIIVEKPMALSLVDCDVMIAAAASNNVQLIVGHTHSFDPAILAMRKLIEAGDLGAVTMITSLNYTDFLYRPRRPEELDTRLGGGILFNQVPHQVDIARLLAGSEVRTVRAVTNVLDPRRPTEGSCMAFLEFESGAGATLVYSGYDRFDSDELHGWVGELGFEKSAAHGAARRNLDGLRAPAAERDARSSRGYGFFNFGATPPHQPHFGTTIVSCSKGDLRQSADGVLVYSDEGASEVVVPTSPGWPGHGEVLEELFRAVRFGDRTPHSGTFGRGTLEVCLAILRSAQERCEVRLEPSA